MAPVSGGLGAQMGQLGAQMGQVGAKKGQDSPQDGCEDHFGTNLEQILEQILACAGAEALTT